MHFAQDAALSSAQALASFGVASKEQREAIKQACKGTSFSTTFGKTLRRLLGCGVGVHHAGMLPRYRLPVICGTDTLGVGINVPIHTVLLTGLTKFDGRRMRRLRSREFHQIAGRAGRSGFDTEGIVLAEAPEFEIENEKARLKAGDDPKKLRKIKKKKPPEGFVTWNEGTFSRLIEAAPEALVPHLRVTHSMVLAEVEQGGDARSRVMELIEASLQTAEQKERLRERADEIFATLIDAGVIERHPSADGAETYTTTVDLPDNFALDQPLAPFMIAALELLDPASETYALDVISMAEATLEDPHQILRAQERAARDRAMAEMKADGVEYEERVEKIADVTYPKPLEDLLETAFASYCEGVPWASDYCLRPKSVLRDMVETASDFKSYIGRYGIARSEGLLLRYLSDAYRVLARTLPLDKRDEQLEDIIAWLGLVVRSVDSSLVDEWAQGGTDDGAGAELAAPGQADEIVRDRRGLTVLVRNALIRRVGLALRGNTRELGALDQDAGFGEPRWKRALDAFYEEHDEIVLDADARSMAYLVIDEKDEKTEHVWHARQIFHDSDDANDFGIAADVDLDATQEGDGVVFKNYRVGFFEEL